MNKNYYAILMAGGVGSRFWPVSTVDFPKQFHDMLGTGETLIQKTFTRLSQIIPKENKSYSIEKKIFNFQINQLLKPNKIPNHLKYYPQDVVSFVENIY